MSGFSSLLCGLLLLWGMAVACCGAPLNVERLLTNDTLNLEDNIGAVNAITQDAEGFMWFGGENGLARFDGHQMRVFRTEANRYGALSSSYIWDLVVDRAGYLWAATPNGLNRYDPDSQSFTTFLHEPDNSQSLVNNNLRALALDKEDNLWIATNGGVSVLDVTRTHFRTLTHRQDDPASLSSNAVRCLLIDSGERLWIGTEGGGLNLLATMSADLATAPVASWQTTSKPLALVDNGVQTLAEDSHGNIWAGTLNGGISRLNSGLTEVRHFVPDKNQRGSISDTIIQKIYRDHEGVIWVGTDHNGLARFNEPSQTFTHFRNSDTNPRSLYGNGVHSIFEDRDGDLWVGTHPKGVNYLNRDAASFANTRHVPGRKSSLSANAVTALLLDADGDLWVGTEGGLNWRRPNSRGFKRLLKDVGNPNALQANPILALAQAGPGEVWVGTWSGGLYRFNKATETFRAYRASQTPGQLNSDFIRRVLVDSQGRVWIGTENAGLNLYHAATDSFVHWQHDPKDPHSLANNYVSDIMEYGDGKIWLATIGGINLFDPATGQFSTLAATEADVRLVSKAEPFKLLRHSSGDVWIGTQYAGILVWHAKDHSISQINVASGLKSNTVASLVEDPSAQVWAGTLYGVARIDPTSFKVKNFGKQQGLAGNIFNRDASLRGPAGDLYIGSTTGLSRFSPGLIRDQHPPPLPRITSVRIHNQGLPLARHQQTPVEVSYDQNAWEFGYSALSYRAARSNLYQYQLQGYENQWSQATAGISVRYSNLPPGNYVFQVKAANSDGVWSTGTANFAFAIASPPWRSTGAYAAYSLLVISALVLLWQWHSRRLQLASERSVNQELRQLHKMKDAFLANTSHELRTPLHGIIGLAESLASGDSGPQNPATQQALLIIVNSGRRLAQLVNDILDFAKLANRQLRLELAAVDLAFSVDTSLALLKPLADAKGLSLHNRVSRELPPVRADANRLQQILFNLIGNAIKFTDRGAVTVLAEIRDDNQCWIEVQDTGIGIPEAEQNHIFTAFSQVATGDNRSQGGTGLGLAICQQLITQLGGTLTGSSRLGEGSTFIFNLPLADANQPISRAAQVPAQDFRAIATLAEVYPAPDAVNPIKTCPKILLVDDDPVNRMVLGRLLSRESYQLLEAASGAEALTQTDQHADLDLIILDVMMPQMSGYEACQILRQTRSISSLPVIFLTAKDQGDDRVRGLLNGGNDFLTKPVAKADLLAHVQLQLALTQSQPGPTAENSGDLQRLAPLQWTLAQGIDPSAPRDQAIPRFIQTLLHNVQTLVPQMRRMGCWQFQQGQFICVAHANLSTMTALRRRQEVAQLLKLLEQREHQQALVLSQPERECFGHLVPDNEILLLAPAFFEGRLRGFSLLGLASFSDNLTPLVSHLKPCLTAALIQLEQTP